MNYNAIKLYIIIFLCAVCTISAGKEPNDIDSFESNYLGIFLERTKRSDALMCSDPLMLRPYCQSTIPGVTELHQFAMNYTIPSMSHRPPYGVLKPVYTLRKDIERMTTERYGRTGLYRYGLYPYMEKPEYMFRQKLFGKMIDQDKPRHVLDIGSYYNPINIFLRSHCPEYVTIVEPILDPLSVSLPCPEGNISCTI